VGFFVVPEALVKKNPLTVMTISGHNRVMTRAKVSELKSKLSAYLAEVRGGATVVVYDRTTPIARLVPYIEDADDLIILDAPDPPSTLRRLKGVRPRKTVNVDKLLRELREDR
jgi:antitoxin (DNA-binding transcriptional repressor) of toxin-antitoxin stability system